MSNVGRHACGCKTLSFSVFGLSFNIWFRWVCRGFAQWSRKHRDVCQDDYFCSDCERERDAELEAQTVTHLRERGACDY